MTLCNVKILFDIISIDNTLEKQHKLYQEYQKWLL